jgi:hypothetical protein
MLQMFYLGCSCIWNCIHKASRVANAILHSFKCKDYNVYMQAFDSYVKPLLEYNCYIWNPIYCYDNDLIEGVQCVFTRRVFKRCVLPYMLYEKRLLYLDRMSIERRRFVLFLTTFYSIYKKFVSCNVLDNALQSNVMYLRGHSKRLFRERYHSNVRLNFLTVKFLPIWNRLPENLISSNVTKAFSNKLFNMNLNCYVNFRYH